MYTKVSIQLLLPLLSLEELGLFATTPADSLLAQGNLPALAQHARVVLCVLARTDVVQRFKQTVFSRFAGCCELQSVPVDDLVLDYPFDVVPSLGYLRGIAAADQDVSGVGFIFLQPNLVLSDGSLSAAFSRLQAGTRILRATYLRVARQAFEKSLTSLAKENKFVPKTLIPCAVETLDLHDIGCVASSDLFWKSRERFIWKHDATTLLIHDFANSLIAISPTGVPAEASGFHDFAFAEAMCPGEPGYNFSDSEEFCAIELCETDDADNELYFGLKDARARGRELAGCISLSQRQSGRQSPAVFHAGRLPANFSRTRNVAETFINQLSDPPGAADGRMHQARWKLSHYLWAVRAFELGLGPLPRAPFAEVFSRHQSGKSTAGPNRRSALGAALSALLRRARQQAVGRVPFVSILHPKWSHYRDVTPILRDAARTPRARITYVADGNAIFGRFLGAPDFTALDLVDGAGNCRLAKPASSDIAIIELSDTGLDHWADVAANLLPSIRTGGRVAIFLRNDAEMSYEALRRVLKRGLAKLDARLVMRSRIAVETSTLYRNWLSQGSAIALGMGRTRRPTTLVCAGALVCLVAALTALLNLLGRRSPLGGSGLEAWSSVTIIIPVDEVATGP